MIYDCGKFPTETIIVSHCKGMKAVKLLHFKR